MELFLQIVGSLLALYVAGVSVMVGSGMAFCRVMRSRMPPDSQQRAVMAAASPTSLGFGVRLVGFGVEVFWQAIALLLQLLHAMGMLAMPKGPADGSPVVLLPGYTESSGNLWRMGRRLARAGYRPRDARIAKPPRFPSAPGRDRPHHRDPAARRRGELSRHAAAASERAAARSHRLR